MKSTENNNVHENQTLPPGVNGGSKPNVNSKKGLGPAPSPIFSFVAAKSHRMIFLLDRTKAMNQNVRLSYLLFVTIFTYTCFIAIFFLVFFLFRPILIQWH